MCVSERERGSVCVCVYEKEREGVCVYVCVFEKVREVVCVCIHVCVWERKKGSVCVYACVCVSRAVLWCVSVARPSRSSSTPGQQVQRPRGGWDVSGDVELLLWSGAERMLSQFCPSDQSALLNLTSAHLLGCCSRPPHLPRGYCCCSLTHTETKDPEKRTIDICVLSDLCIPLALSAAQVSDLFHSDSFSSFSFWLFHCCCPSLSILFVLPSLSLSLVSYSFLVMTLALWMVLSSERSPVSL